MDRSVVNRLLLYAGQVKSNGYAYFKKDYILLALEYLHGSWEKANAIFDKMVKKVVKSYFLNLSGSKLETLSDGSEVISSFDFAIKPADKGSYALSTENSRELKELYALKGTSFGYKELLFQLCFMGIISLREFLRYSDSVDDYIGRLSSSSDDRMDFMYRSNSGSFLSSSIEVSQETYSYVLQCYVEVISEGYDFGMSVYDFIYNYTKNTLRVPKHLWNKNKYQSFIRQICNWRISDFSIFKLPDKQFIEKYSVEIGVCLPKIIGWLSSYYGAPYVERLVKYIISSSDEYLREALLVDRNIFWEANSEGVDCMVALN